MLFKNLLNILAKVYPSQYNILRGDDMGKTSAAVKNRYNAKAYDRLSIIVPKGRKTDVEAAARDRGESVNGMVNELLRGVTGFTVDEWNARLEQVK